MFRECNTSKARCRSIHIYPWPCKNELELRVHLVADRLVLVALLPVQISSRYSLCHQVPSLRYLSGRYQRKLGWAKLGWRAEHPRHSLSCAAQPVVTFSSRSSKLNVCWSSVLVQCYDIQACRRVWIKWLSRRKFSWWLECQDPVGSVQGDWIRTCTCKWALFNMLRLRLPRPSAVEPSIIRYFKFHTNFRREFWPIEVLLVLPLPLSYCGTRLSSEIFYALFEGKFAASNLLFSVGARSTFISEY